MSRFSRGVVMEALRRSVVMPWGPRDSCDLPSISNPAAPHDGPSFRTSETHHPFATSGTTEGHTGFRNPVPICEGYMLSLHMIPPIPVHSPCGGVRMSVNHPRRQKVSREPRASSFLEVVFPAAIQQLHHNQRVNLRV